MALLDFVYPKNCLGCGKKGRYICEVCLVRTKKTEDICPICAKPAIDGLTHSGCKKAYGIDGFSSVFSYQGTLRKVITSLKYKFVKDMGEELVQIFLSSFKNPAFPKKAVITPVPMHLRRLKWRGFNQASLLGRIIAGKKGWVFVPDLVGKIKDTKYQANLKRDERLKNLKGAFAINPKYNLKDSKYPIIVFDDVWTTGATLREIAKTLKRKGAKEVWGLTICR